MSEDSTEVKTFVCIRDTHFSGKYWRRGEEYVQGPGMKDPNKHFSLKKSGHVREVEVEATMAKAITDMTGPQICAYIKKHFDITLPPSLAMDKVKAQALQIIHDPAKIRLADSEVEGTKSPVVDDPEAVKEAEKTSEAREQRDLDANPEKKKFSDMTPDDIHSLKFDDLITQVKARFGVELERGNKSKAEYVAEAIGIEESRDL